MRTVTVDTGSLDDLFLGCCLVWKCTPRGGYGYTIDIPAKVLGYTKKTATISVLLTDGGKVKRRVPIKSLRWSK